MILICRACLAGPSDWGQRHHGNTAGTRAANDPSVFPEKALSRHINTSTAEGGELGNNDHFLWSPKVDIHWLVRGREVTGWWPLARRQQTDVQV